jgi:glycine oxidase
LRPATPDNAPLIGLSSVEGLLFATGHFRNGILLAPVTADAIEATISTGRAPSEIEAFSPGRFSATRERV